MKIERKLQIPPMTLDAFADKEGLIMQIVESTPWARRSGQLRFHAYFKYIEQGATRGAPRTESGRGGTEEEAMRDYATRISGQVIVYQSGTKNERHIQVPELL